MACPSSVNSMMSAASMHSGARARDTRKRPGSAGWRMLTWPKASTTPSRARIRLAVTSSSRTAEKVAMLAALSARIRSALVRPLNSLISSAAIVAAALTLVRCGGAAEATKKSDGKDAVQVTTVQVERIELRREVEAVGTLAAKDQAVISAEVAGRVARLAADMGDRVREGAPLVYLDAEKLKYRLD